MQEREMTKKDKAKEKRLKKKYDDSDMKASMKKQYGDDWKNVYYATIRKKAMEDIKEAKENSYTVVHAKHGKEVIKATSSYAAAKKYADMKKLKSTAGVDAHLMEAIKEGMVKVTNIKWDSDDDVSDLSTTMMVPVPNGMDQEEAEEFIADYITDKTGVTHDGFSMEETKMDPASPELAKIFDNLKRGDKVKIKHDSALEKGTDYIEYVVRSNNVLRNGVEKTTLARADSPTSVKRILYKRNGKVSMAIGDMAATLVDIQVDEGYQVLPNINKERYTPIQGMEGPFMTVSGKTLYYDPSEGSYYDRDTDMFLSYDEFKQYDDKPNRDMRSQAEGIVKNLRSQIAIEGNSPHKKGTKKYKAHMAAMHANSAEPEGQMIETKKEKLKHKVTVEQMKEALSIDDDTSDEEIVASYVRTMLDESVDTWSKVFEEVQFVLSILKEGKSLNPNSVHKILMQRHMQEYFDDTMNIKENVDTLRKIVNDKQYQTVKFTDGSMKVDLTTASLFLQVFDKQRPEIQEKIKNKISTKQGFLTMLDLIYGKM